MPEQAEQDVRQVGTDDPDNLVEEVTDQEVAFDGEEVEEEPDTEADGDKESFEDEPEEQEAIEDEPEQIATDPKIAQLETTVNQLASLMTQMVHQQQNRPAPQQTTPAPRVPVSAMATKTADQLDDMSVAEVSQYSIAKSNERANNELSTGLSSLGTEIGARLQLFGSQIMTIFDVVMGDNPEFSHIKEALKLVETNPGTSLQMAYRTVKSEAVGQENVVLKKQNNSNLQQSRKRSRRAKRQSNRPKPQRTQKQQKFSSVSDALRASMRDQGLQVPL